MSKDHTYPEEHRQAHFERMLQRMVADNKEVRRLLDRLVDKVRKEVD